LARGTAPEWRRRKEPVLDEYVLASINSVPSYSPDTGHYGKLVYTGCETPERGAEIVQALHRSARHLGVSLSATVTPADDGTYSVEFTAINKAHARAYVLAKHGKDRSQWPYDPRKRGS
jgi:hypothetical protein